MILWVLLVWGFLIISYKKQNVVKQPIQMSALKKTASLTSLPVILQTIQCKMSLPAERVTGGMFQNFHRGEYVENLSTALKCEFEPKYVFVKLLFYKSTLNMESH